MKTRHTYILCGGVRVGCTSTHTRGITLILVWFQGRPIDFSCFHV